MEGSSHRWWRHSTIIQQSFTLKALVVATHITIGPFSAEGNDGVCQMGTPWPKASIGGLVCLLALQSQWKAFVHAIERALEIEDVDAIFEE